jgi:hypothetical protein
MKKLFLYLWGLLKASLLIVFVISPIIFYFIDKKNHILEGWGIYLQSWAILLICLMLFAVLFVFTLGIIGVIGSSKMSRQYSYLFKENDER